MQHVMGCGSMQQQGMAWHGMAWQRHARSLSAHEATKELNTTPALLPPCRAAARARRHPGQSPPPHTAAPPWPPQGCLQGEGRRSCSRYSHSLPPMMQADRAARPVQTTAERGLPLHQNNRHITAGFATAAHLAVRGRWAWHPPPRQPLLQCAQAAACGSAAVMERRRRQRRRGVSWSSRRRAAPLDASAMMR